MRSQTTARSSGKLFRAFRRRPSHRLSLRLKRRWRTSRRNAAEVCEILAASGQEPLMKSYYRVLVKRCSFLAFAQNRTDAEGLPYFTHEKGIPDIRVRTLQRAVVRIKNINYELSLDRQRLAGSSVAFIQEDETNARGMHSADEVGGIRVV